MLCTGPHRRRLANTLLPQPASSIIFAVAHIILDARESVRLNCAESPQRRPIAVQLNVVSDTLSVNRATLRRSRGGASRKVTCNIGIPVGDAGYSRKTGIGVPRCSPASETCCSVAALPLPPNVRVRSKWRIVKPRPKGAFEVGPISAGFVCIPLNAAPATNSSSDGHHLKAVRN